MTPESYIYNDGKWGVRSVSAGKKLFLYVDCPINGDDGSLDDILPWDEIANKCDPPFLFGDYSGVPKRWMDKKVFKTSCPKSNPNAIPFFYPVDIGEIKIRPIEECQYFSGFQGTISTHPCRRLIREFIQKGIDNITPVYFLPKDKVFWSYEKKEQEKLHKEYINLLESTMFPLCPRGKGLNSIRFFESLKLGRIPVLAADDTKLPLEWMVDYDEFVVKVPEKDLGLADRYIKKWVTKHNIDEASVKAKSFSDKFFSDPELFTELCIEEIENR